MNPTSLRRPAAFAFCALLLLAPLTVHAGSAFWNVHPASGEWDNPANWTPQTIPNGPGDMATLGETSSEMLSPARPFNGVAIVFQSGASDYRIADVRGEIAFIANASSELQVVILSANTRITRQSGNGRTVLYLVQQPGVELGFSGQSSAGLGDINCQHGGEVTFSDHSTAGTSTIACKQGRITFMRSASAGSARLVADASAIGFFDQSDGGTASVILSNDARLDLSRRGGAAAPITIGSLEGTGLAVLGRPLHVGSNGRSTVFSGQLESSGSRFILTKVGPGTLHLTAPEPALAGAAVSGGTLAVENTTGTGTGMGPVAVNAGRLGGGGIIAGTVTVGTGSGKGATVAPAEGSGKTATLTIQNALTFQTDGTYNCLLDTLTPAADDIAATGITIASGAQFKLVVQGTGTLAEGTSFTILSNTGADPIAGAFANLPDGAILTVNGQQLVASYEGGDGNDLTLTVVQ